MNGYRSTLKAIVMPADEELMIAREALCVLAGAAAGAAGGAA